MKKILLLVSFIFFSFSIVDFFSQSDNKIISTPSKISKITIFNNGASINRIGKIVLNKGAQNMDTLVVDIEELYHQFSAGIYKNPLSIKRFLKFTMQNWPCIA